MKSSISITILFNLIVSNCGSDLGFVHYPDVNMFYKFHREAIVWHQAIEMCKIQNATLAMPKNEAEIKVLNNIFKGYPASTLHGVTHKDFILLGFHDIFEEGEYVTLQGEPIQYYFHTWGQGQPDNLNDEDCGSMHRSERINDFPCQVPAVYICQKDGPQIQNSQFTDCGTDDIAYKYSQETQMCYKLHMDPRPWSTARAICFAEGGHLAIIRSKAEEDNLVRIFNDPNNRVHHVLHRDFALLGFHDLYQEGHYKTVLDENLHDIGYVHWAGGQPDNAGGYENCGSMHSTGGINDFPCSVPAVFICQRPSNRLDVRFGTQKK